MRRTTKEPTKQTDILKLLNTCHYISAQMGYRMGFTKKSVLPHHIHDAMSCTSIHTHTHKKVKKNLSLTSSIVKNGKMMIRDNYGLMVIEKKNNNIEKEKKREKNNFLYSLSSFYYFIYRL